MINKIYTFCITSFALLASFNFYNFDLKFPSYFPEPKYDFTKNPMDSAKIQIGRALFYDPILSADNSISCASCHSPYNAFAHTDHDLSHGINDQIGTRNAPALFNLAWQKSFMWDGAINHLDMQALAPISHSKEMGSSILAVVNKLNESKFYKKLFFEAYNDSLITGEKVLKTLSQFELTLVSAGSKYDQVKYGKAIFNEQEKNGYLLFQKNCNTCHAEPLFTNYDFENNGLSVDNELNDMGRWLVTKNKKDKMLFKTPSLRNLSYTYPYMHDGRFKKLQQVLNHYTTIDPNHQKQLSKKLKKAIVLSSNEKVDLVAFLLTLNDKDFVFNPNFQYPKK
jgi:cytochrome c peroxidase